MLRISNTGIIVAYALIIALLIANAALTYWNTVKLHEHLALVDNTRALIAADDELADAIKDTESAQRAYLYTGNSAYLKQYQSALATVEIALARVERLVSQEPELPALLPELRADLRSELQELAFGLELYERDGFQAARDLVRADGELRSTGRPLALLADMKRSAEGLVHQRAERSRDLYHQAITTSLAASIASLLLFGTAVTLTRRNIAARARASDELSKQSEFLHTTLSSIVEGIVVTDADGRITFMNPVASKMCCLDESVSALGLQVGKAFDLRDASTGEAVPSAVSFVLSSEEPYGVANERLLRVTGKPDRAIEETAAPLRDPVGRIVGTVLALRDVTEKRLHELRVRELLEAERDNAERLREIARASLRLNSSHSRESVLTMLREEACKILDASDAQVLSERALSDSKPGELLAPLIARDGQRVGTIRLQGLRHADLRRAENDLAILQQLANLASVAVENARLYEELRAGDRRKDTFLATLAHELRNPLAPVKNAVQIMRLSRATEADRAKAVESIDRQVALLVRLVDDLLDVSRISRGKVELRRSRSDLAEIVGQALEMSRPFVQVSGQSLSVKLPSERVEIFVDPARVAQIVSNLVNNAAKYSDRGGNIWLSCSVAGDDVAISVRDDGIGIPSDLIDHIFDMFWQNEQALERAQGGLGIGLTLVRQLVDLHGGRVEAKSQGIGLGSEFIVRFPRVVDELPVVTLTPRPRLLPACSSSPIKVLIVDDNEDSAESLAILLGLHGHAIKTAHDGPSALALEADFRPNLVLLDIGLPKIHGYEVARTLREARGDALRIVAMTGFGQAEDRRRSREAGFDHHLVKPIDPNELQRIIAAVPVAS